MSCPMAQGTMVTLNESISTHLARNEAKETLLALVEQKKGVVLCKSDEYVKVKFGSMIVARLFGLFLLDVFNRTLPFRMEAQFHGEPENVKIEISLSDNLGWGIRSKLGNSVYMGFFQKFISDVKKAVHSGGHGPP